MGSTMALIKCICQLLKIPLHLLITSSQYKQNPLQYHNNTIQVILFVRMQESVMLDQLMSHLHCLWHIEDVVDVYVCRAQL